MVGGLYFVWPLLQVVRISLANANVTTRVSSGGIIATPESPPATGLILYPGANVDPEAYLDATQRLAGKGYLVVIPRMPQTSPTSRRTRPTKSSILSMELSTG